MTRSQQAAGIDPLSRTSPRWDDMPADNDRLGTPTLTRDGRVGHGRHGGEAPALCAESDDVGLDPLVLSYQEERTKEKQKKGGHVRPYNTFQHRFTSPHTL